MKIHDEMGEGNIEGWIVNLCQLVSLFSVYVVSLKRWRNFWRLRRKSKIETSVHFLGVHSIDYGRVKVSKVANFTFLKLSNWIFSSTNHFWGIHPITHTRVKAPKVVNLTPLMWSIILS